MRNTVNIMISVAFIVAVTVAAYRAGYRAGESGSRAANAPLTDAERELAQERFEQAIALLKEAKSHEMQDDTLPEWREER